MNTYKKLLAASALALMTSGLMAGGASAKTFVFCSEGSPEGFDPGLYTAGNTFDAAAHTVYNRLPEFKPGTTEPEAWSGRELGRFPTMACSIRSICVRASSSRRPNTSRRLVNSMPMT